jgi:ribosomal protein S6--L-glutamate ligase
MISKKVIALEGRLRQCRNVLTLGVKPNFCDYPPLVMEAIDQAQKIYYPSLFYAELFDTIGKPTFPSYHNYKCTQDKIKQTALFQLLRIPHPRTRVFYGKRQQSTITEHFGFPMVAKIPRGSALGRGVFRIENHAQLRQYLESIGTVAYIQEYLTVDRDLRVVVIAGQVVHAYWRIARTGEFRTNLARGGRVSLAPVPVAALDLAVHTAHSCRWDDVGIDICKYDGQYWVLEANMKYGRQGFQTAGLDYVAMMEKMIEDGQI